MKDIAMKYSPELILVAGLAVLRLLVVVLL